MSRSDHDRDVLFGVLAWQTGLVERSPLLEAMYDCAVGGLGDLPTLLQQRGLLTPADCAWLSGALTRQLSRNEGDVKRTLEGIEAVQMLHRELEQASVAPDARTLDAPPSPDDGSRTKADVQTIVQPREHMSDVRPVDDTASDEPIEGGGLPAATGAEADRFRVLRTHARGGLGEVFIAEDKELKRDVALKQILPRQAGNKTSRARFLLEAEITGKLEHPGVVPVYALGSGADGSPYYAMRFIRGESLEDAIQAYHGETQWDDGRRAKSLQLRELLTRFVAVCHTLEYAHTRGIIHRDIKPENIMLGRYGETLVVDWGLARPYREINSALDADDALSGFADEGQVSQTSERPTQMGSVVGTPQFMSPEQALGRLDQMGPAADVYSLGATLYCLLTDRPAFMASDVRRILLDVQAGDFPPPRQVKRDVPAALEAICLKAMKRDPEGALRIVPRARSRH
ncbi:MAG: serine/threonine-protein kinase [Pirellulales bacterium]